MQVIYQHKLSVNFDRNFYEKTQLGKRKCQNAELENKSPTKRVFTQIRPHFPSYQFLDLFSRIFETVYTFLVRRTHNRPDLVSTVPQKST